MKKEQTIIDEEEDTLFVLNNIWMDIKNSMFNETISGEEKAVLASLSDRMGKLIALVHRGDVPPSCLKNDTRGKDV